MFLMWVVLLTGGFNLFRLYMIVVGWSDTENLIKFDLNWSIKILQRLYKDTYKFHNSLQSTKEYS